LKPESSTLTPDQKDSRPRRLWTAFIRILLLALLVLAGSGIYLGLNPAALQDLITRLPLPGSVRIPTAGPTLPVPVILAPAGPLPSGSMALTGVYAGGIISCGFLLELDGGQRVGITAAHASPVLAPGTPAEFQSPDGVLVATLAGQIGQGATFVQDRLSMDYVLWSLAEPVDLQRFLKPDERGQGQPGEPVLVYSPFGDNAGGPKTWPGVVMSSSTTATWIHLDDSFPPGGFSGCPVISRVTGRLIGMAVAGADQPPVVMGLHPVGSLVEKARAALKVP
jgi:hypothetical protein